MTTTVEPGCKKCCWGMWEEEHSTNAPYQLPANKTKIHWNSQVAILYGKPAEVRHPKAIYGQNITQIVLMLWLMSVCTAHYYPFTTTTDGIRSKHQEVNVTVVSSCAGQTSAKPSMSTHQGKNKTTGLISLNYCHNSKAEKKGLCIKQKNRTQRLANLRKCIFYPQQQ